MSENKFEVETILPPGVINDPNLKNDWHEILMCQALGEKTIVIDLLKLTVGEKSFHFSKGDMLMLAIGLEVSNKAPGIGLLTASWPDEFSDLQRRTFLETNSSKNGHWRGKAFYVIDLLIIEKISFLKLGTRK